MSPSYCVLDCVPTPDGRYVVVDVRGGIGGNLAMLAAHGSKSEVRARLIPYLTRLAEIAGNRRILFIYDPFTAGQTFPDDFFAWV
ncbi:MAG: hypothetical protein ACO1SX_09955, partial [Actinomycetota bacterium]